MLVPALSLLATSPPGVEAAARLPARDDIDKLLLALRMEVSWIDKRLGDLPGCSPDDAQAMRLEMRCKCHAMASLIERALQRDGEPLVDPAHAA
jgi:hypothetical protein